MFWSQEELSFLKENYVETEVISLSHILNHTPTSIRVMACRLKLSKYKARENIKLDYEETQIILGSLLGDMYCRIHQRCKNAQIEGAHCTKQEPYLLWKVNSLKNISIHLRRGKLGQLHFESKNYPCLNYYHNLFYKKGKKKVTMEVLNQIGELGLAVWYMDDGHHKKGKRSYLFTNGFTYKENVMIKNWFERRWDILPKIYIKKGLGDYYGTEWFYLAFSVEGTRKLINIIKNYIHPSMKYKMGCY